MHAHKQRNRRGAGGVGAKMDETTRARLCALYDLGAPVGNRAAPVRGGFQHRMWRIETRRGVWAVKQLGNAARGEEGRARIERTERVAREAHAHGFPALVAVASADNGACVREIADGVAVVVYPWAEGETLAPGPAAPNQAQQIGALLARLHTLNLPGDGLLSPPRDHFAPDELRDFVVRGRGAGAAWADEFADGLNDVLAASEAARIASEVLAHEQVVGHRDLDQKNVLWRSGTGEPVVLDWEQACLTHPAQEAMGCALNWAGVSAGPPDKIIFQAFVQGYRAVAPLQSADLAVADGGVLGKWLLWLHVCLSASLDDAAPPPERDAAGERARHALSVLRGLVRDAPVRRAWIVDAVPA